MGHQELTVAAIFLSILTRFITCQDGDCSREEYDRCVKMADPLLKDPHLIFPDNLDDVDHVCRRWNQFVDCVKHFTDRCFTETRRQEFNKAVESPVDSVHQMCTVQQYQTEYLQYATCIKSTVTRDEHCGQHYRHLVDQVSGDVARSNLCCSHHRFRECVLTETKRQCDNGANGGSAARFSRQVLDKALSFLRDQCYNYMPNPGECPGLTLTQDQMNNREDDNNLNPVPDQQHRPSSNRPFRVDNPPSHSWSPTGEERRVTSSSPDSSVGSSSPWLPGGGSTDGLRGGGSTDGYRGGGSTDGYRGGGSTDSHRGGGSTDSHRGSGRLPSEGWTTGAGSDASSPHQRSSSSAWLPGNTADMSGHTAPLFTTTTEGPSRSSSYGRGITWTQSSASSEHTWRVTSNPGSGNSYTTEQWYPAINSYSGSNSVDEPNQQGLTNNKKNSARGLPSVTVTLVAGLALLAAVLS